MNAHARMMIASPSWSLAIVMSGLLAASGCGADGIRLYAPPEFAGGKISANGHIVGEIGQNQRGYRWVGFRKMSDEFGAPPRSESRATLRLPPGNYVLELSQDGYEPIRHRLHYDGAAPDEIDLSARSVTPALIWPDKPDAATSAAYVQEFTRARQIAIRHDYRGAAHVFGDLLRVREDPAVMVSLALSEWHVGDRQAAMRLFSDVKAEYPGYWIRIYNEAVLLLKEERVERARAVADDLRRIQPSNPAYIRLASAVVSRTGG